MNIKPIKKVKYRDRKHFMCRNHGPYDWGKESDSNTKYDRWQSTRYGQKSGCGATKELTKRELLNSAERHDEVDFD